MAKTNEIDREIMNILAPPYRRPSKRGKAGEKRELVISDLLRPPSNKPGSREQRVPCIRFSGTWLEERGFLIGGRVEITEEHGRLVLTAVVEEQASSAKPGTHRARRR